MTPIGSVLSNHAAYRMDTNGKLADRKGMSVKPITNRMPGLKTCWTLIFND